MNRRELIKRGAGLAVALPLELGKVQPGTSNSELSDKINSSALITPNGRSLPWKMVGKAKVFHLIAEEVDHFFADGISAKCWGYNGSVHGPTIEAVEGDWVRIYVTNKLAFPTSVHWHGLILPNGMDGVGGLNQKPIMPGETFIYEYRLQHHGTFMYHSHHDEMTQMAMGMMGMFVVHPRRERNKVDRDFAMMLSEWKVDPGTSRPDPNEMTDFNLLTINGKVFPATQSLVVKTGDRVRIRIGNLSAMDHHPMHLHGHAFKVVGTDGGDVPKTAQYPETSILVPVGATRTIEFVADQPGDWGFHCHMTHHVMNQMGHELPNMTGTNQSKSAEVLSKLIEGYTPMEGMDMGEHISMGHMDIPDNSIPMVGQKGPYGYITMGGMFTLLKVRSNITSYEDPGWYQLPEGTQARLASETEIERDLKGLEIPQPDKTVPKKVEKKMDHSHH